MTLRKTQLLTTAGLSLLFLIVYGGTAQITALRTDVGTLYFEWERYIPFVPIFIIPYMSIDLFFIAAPFFCTDHRELKIFSKRIALGILIAGFFFLAFPLKLVVPRPEMDGPIGAIFKLLHGFDMPYNLLPSLHIILRTILAHHYIHTLKKGSGVFFKKYRLFIHILLHFWFFLIGLSTLLVYQHHIADVIAGFIVSAFIFYIVSDRRQRTPVVPNPRIGIYYLITSAILLIAALLTWPWGILLLWPTLSLTIVASAYFGVGPAITAKANGRIPFTSRLILGPWLLGQRLSLRHYQRQCDPWNPVTPNLWIGRVLTDQEAQQAVEQGVRAVVDLTCEFDEAKPFLQQHYLNAQVMDLTAPPPDVLRNAATFIADHAKQGVVYVHCKIGYSRSVAIVAAYLLQSGEAKTVDQAIEMIRRVRPAIVVRPEIRAALTKFAESLA